MGNADDEFFRKAGYESPLPSAKTFIVVTVVSVLLGGAFLGGLYIARQKDISTQTAAARQTKATKTFDAESLAMNDLTLDEINDENAKIQAEIDKRKVPRLSAKEKEEMLDKWKTWLRELEEKQELCLKSSELLKLFKVQHTRFYFIKRGVIDQPEYEMTVANSTGYPISRVYFRKVLSSPGRAVPWVEDKGNYSIPGGLENGESATWKLRPDILLGGVWNRAPIDRTDLILTIIVTGLDGPDNKKLTPLFSEHDAKWLKSLKNDIEHFNGK